jgi:hypothetical protein
MGSCLTTAAPVVKKTAAEIQIPPSRLRGGSPGAIISNEFDRLKRMKKHHIDLTRYVT